DRVAIVTGGTDGIGYATARQLARLGMHVIIAGNNDSKAQDVVRRLKEETSNDKVEFLYCDLASLTSIRQFVQKFKKKKIPLHVLVNNGQVRDAGRRQVHHRLTRVPLCPPSRCYSPHGAYAQSKLALVLFTYHLQRLLAAQGSPVTANVADPGVVDTDLYRHVFWGTRLIQKMLGWWAFKTPDEGAWTSVYAAVTPDLEGIGGRYLYNEKETKSLMLTYDRDLQRQLWAISCQMTSITDVT
uniref:Dehydrogenase/reductase SDR family member on chromosome X n=1 Tax=Panthera tigris altaica TaxID=74533 RepID=A0A8C9M3X6_PANTA